MEWSTVQGMTMYGVEYSTGNDHVWSGVQYRE